MHDGYGFHYGPCNGRNKGIGIVIAFIAVLIGLGWINKHGKQIDHDATEIALITVITIGSISFIAFCAIVYAIVKNVKESLDARRMNYLESKQISPVKKLISVMPERAEIERTAPTNGYISETLIREMIREYYEQNREM